MAKQIGSQNLINQFSMSPDRVLKQLKQYPVAHNVYCSLPEKYQQEFMDFCTGKTSLYLCYDTFFHYIFDTNAHQDRVEGLLSAIFGQEIHIIEILPREGSLMAEKGSEVVVDLLVRLENQSLVNLEIQKYGYRFPVMRMDCYCADLIMREYNRLHNIYKDKFTYKMLHPVVAIVLLEKSPEEFKSKSKNYIHKGRTSWDTGLKLNGLTEQIYVCLDKFNKLMQNEDITTTLDAWLTLLTTQSLARIDKLVRLYPDFAEIYREIFQFRTQPKELIYMYSEALTAADRNMDRMMIDEIRDELEQLQSELARKKEELVSTKAAIASKDEELASKEKKLEEQNKTLAESLADNAKLQEEIRILKSNRLS